MKDATTPAPLDLTDAVRVLARRLAALAEQVDVLVDAIETLDGRVGGVEAQIAELEDDLERR